MKENKEYRLPRAFGEKWLQALKSGEYPKGIVSLASRKKGKKTFNYCCLGVACVLEGVDPEKLRDYGAIVSNPGEPDPFPKTIPEELRGPVSKPLIAQLTALNDNSKRDDFQDVTDWIEQYVELY
jgi:hypothetical protein